MVADLAPEGVGTERVRSIALHVVPSFLAICAALNISRNGAPPPQLIPANLTRCP